MEEQLFKGKSYDINIIKRLLKYAKPFIGWIIVSIILVIGVVGIELFRPILIGSAVDELITDYNIPYSITNTSKIGDIQIGDYNIVADKGISDGVNKGRIIYDDRYETGYFFVAGLTYDEAIQLKIDKVEKREGQFIIKINNEDKEVLPLTSEQLKMLRTRDIDRLLMITGLFVGALVAGLFLNYFQTLILHYTGQKIIYNIRQEIFSHVQGLSVQFFNNNPVGRLVTRITNDTETLNEMYTSVIVNSVNNILMIIGISVFMIILDWKLTLMLFIVLPLIAVATVLFRYYSIKAYREVRTKVATLNTFLSEHLSGMKIVQIFTQEERKMKAFENTSKDLLSAHLKQLILFSIYRPYMYFMYIVGLVIVLGYGGLKVMEGTMSIGTLVIFIQYVSIFFEPIQQLAEQFDILQSAMASAEKIFSLLDEESQIVDDVDNINLKEIKGEIEFKNVWFAYDNEDWVLKDVSFTVKPGETVAFVGATGAGKTSILSLINRYYDIQKGEILLDGIPLRKIKLKSLRTHIGQMLQDVFLFTGSIKSNIRLKNEEITDEQIVEAATYVNANRFIQKLPKKYDEKVYERGATFSAGQRQLLSFARTLAYSPSILILDEATSNIDTETEVLIQDALIKLMKGRTTLVVAHRLSTIQHSDKIIVLHKGRIKETGNHQELLAQKGIYHSLYQLQYQDSN